MTQIISLVGKSQSGKTTFLVKLIRELKQRGYRVGTIKHAHQGFDIDRRGKDSWQHRQAGADTVLVAAPGQIAMIKDEDGETLDAYAKYFPDVDIVITEGFKRGNRPKIEILRAARNRTALCGDDDALFALVTDTDTDLGVPRFGLEDVGQVADLIEKRYLGNARK